MTEEQKKKLEQKLWNIADTLRGKMNADEFRDYILGFIFYKYLSERLYIYANNVLREDGLDFANVSETTDEGRAILDAVSEAAVDELGYFLKPSELFSAVAKRGSKPGNFIIEDLARILNNIERSTMGTESEDDFDDLFSDMDLTSNKLGRTEEAKNTLIAKVLTHLDSIDFELEKIDSDVLGDAYEYLIGQFASGAGKKAGEFYTPQQVSTILARIVTTGKTRIMPFFAQSFEAGQSAYRSGDYAAALHEWKPLAEQGDADAQYNLGFMYDKGQGVPQDYAEAVRWYQASAEQGDAPAQNSLGFMYSNGQGVPQDYVMAHIGSTLRMRSVPTAPSNGIG